MTVTGSVLRPRRLVYLGTPSMAVPPLEALVAHGFEVVAVVTRPDTRRGRGGAHAPSPVKQAAERLGLPVLHRVDDVVGLDADLGVVVAFGQMIRPHVLEHLRMVNLHFSLLPRWRGAGPVERALLAGDEVTGVCLMEVEEGLDTGGVHARVEVPIAPDATGERLRADLVAAGTQLLVDSLQRGLGDAVAQSGDPVYAAKIGPDDLRLDWAATAVQRHRVVRLGGAWTTLRGRRLKVLAADVVDQAATGGALVDGTAGGLRLIRVQPEGRGPMSWRDFANGAQLAPGDELE